MDDEFKDQFTFLITLYDLTSSSSALVSMFDVGEKAGLDRVEIPNIAAELAKEDCIKIVSLGSLISITDKGKDVVEEHKRSISLKNSNGFNDVEDSDAVLEAVSAIQLKKELFPEATDDDWRILKKWFSEIDLAKQERTIPIGIAKNYCPNETAIEVDGICKRFRNIPVNLQANQDILYLETVYKMLVDEDFKPLSESKYWYPYLEEVYYKQQTKNNPQANVNTVFEIGDLKARLATVWLKKNQVPAAQIGVRNPDFTSLIITHLLSPYPNDKQLMLMLNPSDIRRRLTSTTWLEEFLSRWFFNYRISALTKKDELRNGADKDNKNYKMSHHIHSDIWAKKDLLDYKIFATATAEFIKNKKTDVPLTIGIFAKWGMGKTSLMRFIAEEFNASNENLNIKDFLTFKKKEFPVVWINAWRCETNEQVWASLVNSIIADLSEQASFFRRQLFWFKLWQSRFEQYRLKHDAFSLTFILLITVSVASVLKTVLFPFPLLVDFFKHLLNDKQIFVPIVGVTVSVVIIWTFLKWIFESLNNKKDNYMRYYDHDNKLGYYSIVEKDLKLAFDHFVDPQKPAIIFIDDLDRCSPRKTITIVEALNHFMSGEFGQCVIVLGADANMVAGLLSSEYEKLKDHVTTSGFEGDSIGWSFMEKFVQLPFFMPRLNKDKQLEYAKNLFNVGHVTQTQASSEGNLTDVDSKNKDEVKETILLIKKTIQASLDQDPEISELLGRHISWFYHSPRMVKRFINILRFYQSIEEIKKVRNQISATTDELAYWLILSLRWPRLVRWVQWGGKENTIHDSAPIIRAKYFEDLVNKYSETQFVNWFEELENKNLEYVVSNSPRKLFEYLKSKKRLDLVGAVTYGIW